MWFLSFLNPDPFAPPQKLDEKSTLPPQLAKYVRRMTNDDAAKRPSLRKCLKRLSAVTFE
jgi:hypothetical protein